MLIAFRKSVLQNKCVSDDQKKCTHAGTLYRAFFA